MKYLFKIIIIAVALVTAIPSFAVTDKEMEQAKTIAAKHYLRYANNGSDYLDKLNPSSMTELTNSLKSKEKENLKSFNAVAVPKDYASWDKDKLVQYWSSTFFKSSGLKEDGKKCLGILAKNLKKINVGAPAAAAQTSSAESAKAEPEAAPSTANAATPAPAESQSQAVEVQETTEAEKIDAETAEVVAQAQADAGVVEEQPRKSSNTTLYIVILVLLVAGVIWLVVYASKSMKETGANLSDHKASEKEIRETKRAAKEELQKMRDQYASSLTSKNSEIKQLKSKCESLESELEAARNENTAIRRELDMARRELASNQTRRPEPVQPRPVQAAAPAPAPAPAAEKPQPAPARQGGLPPLVYLGFVNQRGLFVKASRSLNTDSSVFIMDIPDGHHGQFRVVNDAKILDRLLENVDQWLAGGCVIENPEDADIANEIVTLQPGEAVFSENTCRVTKKARIKFI